MKKKYLTPLFLFGISFIIAFSVSVFAKTTTPETTIEPAPAKTLRHVVLFKFKEGTSKEDLAAIEASFAGLPGKIPEIVAFEWGTNNSPEGLDKGFTHCFFVSFADEKGREIYLPHPDHKAFVDLASPHIDDVLVVDYWVE